MDRGGSLLGIFDLTPVDIPPFLGIQWNGQFMPALTV
jgi:hypothetical protein